MFKDFGIFRKLRSMKRIRFCQNKKDVYKCGYTMRTNRERNVEREKRGRKETSNTYFVLLSQHKGKEVKVIPE